MIYGHKINSIIPHSNFYDDAQHNVSQIQLSKSLTDDYFKPKTPVNNLKNNNNFGLFIDPSSEKSDSKIKGFIGSRAAESHIKMNHMKNDRCKLSGKLMRGDLAELQPSKIVKKNSTGVEKVIYFYIFICILFSSYIYIYTYLGPSEVHASKTDGKCTPPFIF